MLTGRNALREQREFSRLIVSGGALFAFGLLAGLIYTFALIGQIEVWPLPWHITLASYWDADAWRRAHVGSLMNAIAVLVFASAAKAISLPDSSWFPFALCVQATAWLNSAAYVLAAILGVRGLSGNGSETNLVVYLLFLMAVITAFIQSWLLARHAWYFGHSTQVGP